MQSYWKRAAVTEAAMWRNLGRLVLRKPVRLAPGDVPFGYLGVVKPILGVFIGLSVVEIPILDLIIRHVVPWPPARWIMLGLSIWGLLWMIGFYAALKLNPHLTGTTGIRVRLGASVDVTVPWSNVEQVAKRYRSMPSSRSVQIEPDGERTVLHVVAGGQTSIDVRLREPATFTLPKGPSGPVHEIRCYADDSDGLRAAATRFLTTAP